jgi:hypothetical protein
MRRQRPVNAKNATTSPRVNAPSTPTPSSRQPVNPSTPRAVTPHTPLSLLSASSTHVNTLRWRSACVDVLRIRSKPEEIKNAR